MNCQMSFSNKQNARSTSSIPLTPISSSASSTSTTSATTTTTTSARVDHGGARRWTPSTSARTLTIHPRAPSSSFHLTLIRSSPASFRFWVRVALFSLSNTPNLRCSCRRVAPRVLLCKEDRQRELGLAFGMGQPHMGQALRHSAVP